MNQDVKESTRSIVSDTIIYAGCTYISQIIAFLGGIVIRRILGPEDMGTWSLVQIYLTYSIIAELGIISGAEKEIPFFYGKGEKTKAHQLKNFMFSWIIVVSFVAGIILAAIGLVFQFQSVELKTGVVFLAVLCPLQLLVNSFSVLLRANKKFGLLGVTNVLYAIVFAGMSIGLAVWLGVYGMYLALVATLVLNLLFWFTAAGKKEEFRPGWNFNRPDFLHVFGIGFPMMVNSIIGTFFMTMDSLIVGNVLGTLALGYYGIGVSLNKFIYNVPNAFSIVMFPRYQEKYGKTEDKNQLYDYIKLPTIGLAFFVLPILIGLGFFFMPFVVRQILPKFEPGIIILKILLAGTFFISLIHMPGQFLYTIYKQRQVIMLSVITFALFFVILLAFTYIGLNIEMIAIATAIAYFTSLVIFMYYALSFLTDLKSRLLMILSILIAFSYSTAALWLIDSVNLFFHKQLLEDLGATSLKFAAYIVAILPLIIYCQVKIKLITRLLRKLV